MNHPAPLSIAIETLSHKKVDGRQFGFIFAPCGSARQPLHARSCITGACGAWAGFSRPRPRSLIFNVVFRGRGPVGEDVVFPPTGLSTATLLRSDEYDPQDPGTVMERPFSLGPSLMKNGTARSAHFSASGKPPALPPKVLRSMSVSMIPGFTGMMDTLPPVS